MIRFRSTLAILLLSSFLATRSDAQSPSPATDSPSAAEELLSLSKKITEQSIKIDVLSRQILRLQQEIERPKATALGSPLPAVPEEAVSLPGAAGSTHVVAPRETLTSIAKMYKVRIDELQKLNHIENDRKLQIGQTLVIPGAPETAPSPSPSASAPNE